MTDINEKTIAEAYQPLFDFMSNEYGKTLLKSEMDEIISAVDKVNENLTELWRVKCDVDGCNGTSANGGGHYRGSGYWCLCSKHSDKARNGASKPKMKIGAIEREEKRKLSPDGVLR